VLRWVSFHSILKARLFVEAQGPIL
jgi:hypothetical protein